MPATTTRGTAAAILHAARREGMRARAASRRPWSVRATGLSAAWGGWHPFGGRRGWGVRGILGGVSILRYGRGRPTQYKYARSFVAGYSTSEMGLTHEGAHPEG
jgi:hypothetical protein